MAARHLKTRRHTLTVMLCAAIAAVPGTLAAQGGRGGGSGEASQLDSQGKTAEARVIFQRLIDTAADPAAKAAAQR